MGKRKNKDEEEYLERKMRKLERKMAKIRRKRLSSSSCSSVQEQNQVSEGSVDSVWCSEVEQTQGKQINYLTSIVDDLKYLNLTTYIFVWK